MNWLRNSIAQRLGGAQFDLQPLYKFEKIKRLKKNFLIKNPQLHLLDFGIGEPDGIAPDCVVKTLQAYCGKLDYNGYADNGAEFFKDAIIHYMDEFFSVHLNHKQILPVLGIKSGLTLLAGTLINPKDVVLHTTPGYDVFATQAKFFGGQTYPLSLSVDKNFLPDLDSVPEEIKKKAKVLILNYPNNPTGAIATKDFYEKNIELAHRYHWIILQDAAYSALAYGEYLSILQISGADECCVELHSMSKGFTMTGWRLGWICGNELLIKACSLYKNHCDSGQFLAIQKAASVGLGQASVWLPKLKEKYLHRLHRLCEILCEVGFRCEIPKAGFFLYAKTPKQIIFHEKISEMDSAQEASQWLLENLGMVTVPWDDCGAFLRFSVTFRSENEEDFFQEVKQRLSPYRFI